MHVALRREYRDRRVAQGTVVYIAAEGEFGIKAPAHTFRQARMSETAEDPAFDCENVFLGPRAPSAIN